MSQSTIFAILMILLAKRKVTRDYLAERFSVSKRTVSRYITELIDAGIPIISTSGHHGGYSLADDYIVDKSVITEAESLRIKDALSKTVSLYDDKVNLALIEKLNAVDAVRAQDSYVIKQDNMYIDYDDCQAAEIKSKIKTLSEAIEQTRATDIKYTDARGAVSYRTIEPYTLVFKAGAWYIYAMCRLRGDFRLFKLTRISDLRKTSKRFVKLESKLIEKLELEFYNEVYVDLEFEFFPAVMESVVDWLGIQAVTERGTKLVAHAEVPMNDALIKRLLSYGSSIKVLAPTDIRETLRDEAKRMSKLYGE
ncbi:MAG: YafY family transcriptional regulator [Clostridiales bacterium]|nr:YafY family transcriptional regulator [Clostridiales bacterium]